MGSGIDFAGDGSADTSRNVGSSGQPEHAKRGAQGGIDMAGNGADDTMGTIDISRERGTVPPGGDIVFAGDGSEDA